MSTFKIASIDYIDNNKSLFKKKSENQNYISFDNSLKINGDLYIGGLRPATTSFKLKFPQNGEKVGFYFGLNGTNQGHVLNMDLENTDESIKAFCNKINGLGNKFNPNDCSIPGNGTLEASFERSSETDVFLSLSLYTSKELQYGNGMRLFGGVHWQTLEPQFAPWDDTVLPQGPQFSDGGTPTNYSLTVNGSPLKEFKSIEENTSGVHIVNNFDISNSDKETLLTVNDAGVVVGKNGAISTTVDISSYRDVCNISITSESKRLDYQSIDLREGIDHIVDVLNGKAAATPVEYYSNNFKVAAKKLSSTEFSLMLLDEGLTVDNCSGTIGEDYGHDTPLTFIKETPNFNMYVNGQLYDKNGREILGGGGGGGETKAKAWLCTKNGLYTVTCDYNNLEQYVGTILESVNYTDSFGENDSVFCHEIAKVVFKEEKSMAEVNQWLNFEAKIGDNSKPMCSDLLQMAAYGFCAVCPWPDNVPWPEDV